MSRQKMSEIVVLASLICKHYLRFTYDLMRPRREWHFVDKAATVTFATQPLLIALGSYFGL